MHVEGVASVMQSFSHHSTTASQLFRVESWYTAGDRLASVMHGKRTLLHANHGVIVCTETVAEAFDYLYYLDKAAQITVKAMSTGRPIRLIPDHVCESFHTEQEPPHLVKVCCLIMFCRAVVAALCCGILGYCALYLVCLRLLHALLAHGNSCMAPSQQGA